MDAKSDITPTSGTAAGHVDQHNKRLTVLIYPTGTKQFPLIAALMPFRFNYHVCALVRVYHKFFF